MTEEEYRAEMAKQARLANLIALRRLMNDSANVSRSFDPYALHQQISDGLGV